jgi:hypothetical protein
LILSSDETGFRLSRIARGYRSLARCIRKCWDGVLSLLPVRFSSDMLYSSRVSEERRVYVILTVRCLSHMRLQRMARWRLCTLKGGPYFSNESLLFTHAYFPGAMEPSSRPCTLLAIRKHETACSFRLNVSHDAHHLLRSRTGLERAHV